MQSGVLTGNDTGSAAQVAAAHCPTEQTLDLGILFDEKLSFKEYGHEKITTANFW